MKSTQALCIPGITSTVVPFSTIEKMVRRGTLRCQRDQAERALRATYLKGTLIADQLVFHAVKQGRTIELADGYTRVERIWAGEVAAPTAVLLITHTCKSDDDVVAVYDMLNNQKAAKTGRDRVQEGLRMSKLKGTLTSHLILAGPLASAAKLATGARDVRLATCEAASAIRFVDALQLGREKVTSGVLGALLAIALNEPDQSLAETFIRGVQNPEFEAETLSDDPIGKVRDNQLRRRQNRTVGGGTAGVELRDFTLAAYLKFRTAVKKPSKLTLLSMAKEVSLGSFVETMKTAK
jgi:hypothetical protein